MLSDEEMFCLFFYCEKGEGEGKEQFKKSQKGFGSEKSFAGGKSKVSFKT